jgi:hypothetical protein
MVGGQDICSAAREPFKAFHFQPHQGAKDQDQEASGQAVSERPAGVHDLRVVERRRPIFHGIGLTAGMAWRTELAGDDRVPWWVRAVLLIAAAQALLLLAALVDPPQVKLLVPWPASPLNARFIAALYVSLGAGVALASTSRHFAEIRLVLFGIGLATMVLLILTIVRMALHPQELKQFPFFWLLFYVIDPVLVAAVFWRMGWGGQASAGFRPLTFLWAAESLIFGSAGIVLMIDPSAARSVWPWAITEPQAQIYSAFFLTLAAVSILAAREERWEGIRWFVVMITLLSLLVIAVSILHLPRFTNATTTALWFVVFGVEAVVFGALLVRGTLRPREAASS